VTTDAHESSLPDGADALAAAIRAEVGKAFIGQEDVLDAVMIALLAGGHVLLEGVPGLGKTLLVRALSQALGCAHARVQFTPDLMPSDISGHAVFDPKQERFEIRRGPVFTNLLLADEINRAPAKTQSALLEAMQEQQVTIEGNSFPLPPPFMCLATQNPLELEGTYPLPEAQLDRFLLKVLIGYPSLVDEKRMVAAVSEGRTAADFDLSQVAQVADPAAVLMLQRRAAAVRVDAAVLDYAVRIVAATRAWPGIALGAGPRGSIALVRAARAQAMLEGRDFVVPDDVRGIAKPALRHRIALAPELQIEGQSADDVLHALLAKVDAPRQWGPRRSCWPWCSPGCCPGWRQASGCCRRRRGSPMAGCWRWWRRWMPGACDGWPRPMSPGWRRRHGRSAWSARSNWWSTAVRGRCAWTCTTCTRRAGRRRGCRARSTSCRMPACALPTGCGPTSVATSASTACTCGCIRRGGCGGSGASPGPPSACASSPTSPRWRAWPCSARNRPRGWSAHMCAGAAAKAPTSTRCATTVSATACARSTGRRLRACAG